MGFLAILKLWMVRYWFILLPLVLIIVWILYRKNYIQKAGLKRVAVVGFIIFILLTVYVFVSGMRENQGYEGKHAILPPKESVQ